MLREEVRVNKALVTGKLSQVVSSPVGGPHYAIYTSDEPPGRKETSVSRGHLETVSFQ